MTLPPEPSEDASQRAWALWLAAFHESLGNAHMTAVWAAAATELSDEPGSMAELAPVL